MNLYQKIVEIRKEAKGFDKDKKSNNYEYVSGNQVLRKIRDKMNELNVLLIPSAKLGEHHTHEYKNSYGKDKIDFIVSGEMTYLWINGDEPSERLEVKWAYYGQQDDLSKAYGSGLTYSERYFIMKCLGLPTDEDDPDGKDPEQTPTEKLLPKKPVEPRNKPTTTKDNISDKQINRLFAIGTSRGQTKDVIDKSIKKSYGKDEAKDLTKTEYDELCKRLKKLPMKG